MKHRLERVNEVLKRELGMAIVRELTFAGALVTVHAVDVSPDLKSARVYISVIGNKAQTKAAMSKLEENHSLIQREVSKRVVLKYMPHFYFHLDDSIARGSRIMDILGKIETPEDEVPEDEAPEDEAEEEGDERNEK